MALDDAPSAVRCQFAKQASASAFSHFPAKPPYGFLSDCAAFAASTGSLGAVESQEKLRSLPFAVFPQSQGLPHGILVGVQLSAFNGALSNRTFPASPLPFATSSSYAGPSLAKC